MIDKLKIAKQLTVSNAADFKRYVAWLFSDQQDELGPNGPEGNRGIPGMPEGPAGLKGPPGEVGPRP